MSSGWYLRERTDAAKRDLRVNLGAVDNATAEALLVRYRACIRTHVGRYGRSLERHFYVVTCEDLRAVAETAVLEAYVRYRDDHPQRETIAGAGLGAYVDRMVRWRLADHVTAHQKEGPSAAERRELQIGATTVGIVTGDPTREEKQKQRRDYLADDRERSDETVYKNQISDWLRRAIGRLEPREAIILISIAQGETNEAVGASLGIRRQTVNLVYHQTIKKLRRAAKRSGLDASELGA